MESTNTPVCPKCGTKMVPVSKPAQAPTLDGSFKLDGTISLNGMVCPKCHPELVNK